MLIKKELKEEEFSENVKQKDEIQQEIEAQKKIKEQIQDRFRQLEEVQGLQERWDNLEKDKDALNKDVSQNKKDLKTEIAQQGYNVFLTQATGHFQEMIDNLRNRGELPTGIKKQFVDDLLLNEVCICGRPIGEHALEARLAVEEWKNRAGMADVEEKAIRMGGEVANTEKKYPRIMAKN